MHFRVDNESTSYRSRSGPRAIRMAVGKIARYRDEESNLKMVRISRTPGLYQKARNESVSAIRDKAKQRTGVRTHGGVRLMRIRPKGLCGAAAMR